MYRCSIRCRTAFLLKQETQLANGQDESSSSEKSCFLLCTQTQSSIKLLQTLLSNGGTSDKYQLFMIRSMHPLKYHTQLIYGLTHIVCKNSEIKERFFYYFFRNFSNFLGFSFHFYSPPPQPPGQEYRSFGEGKLPPTKKGWIK